MNPYPRKEHHEPFTMAENRGRGRGGGALRAGGIGQGMILFNPDLQGT